MPSGERCDSIEAMTPDQNPVCDVDEFRATMASVCMPVTVVTAMDAGRPHGTTVSAFSSLSIEPPLVMVALDRGSDLLAIIVATKRFGVNLLAHGQEDLALKFARKGSDKFDNVAWLESHGLPRLDMNGGWVVCELDDLREGGDHMILLGRVLKVEPVAGAPLVYHNRLFGTHSEYVTIDAPEVSL